MLCHSAVLVDSRADFHDGITNADELTCAVPVTRDGTATGRRFGALVGEDQTDAYRPFHGSIE